MEIDSMGAVANNYATGFIRGKGKYVGSTPTWIEIYPSTGKPATDGYFADGAYRQTLAPDGVTRLSYGGRMVVGGVHALNVLDNRPLPNVEGFPPRRSEIQVVSLNGGVYLHPNQPFKLYDDDDFNNSDGSQKDGDEGEDVAALYDSLSKMLVSDNPDDNAYAAAYIVPEYGWAVGQGLNSSSVNFVLNSPCSGSDCLAERDRINANRGSQTLERDDFWVGYLLVSYQGDDDFDVDPRGFMGGYAPNRNETVRGNTDSFEPFLGVPPGGIGAVVFVEPMRDWALSPAYVPGPFSYDVTFARTRTAPHEVGHQFGLDHNAFVETGGLMSYNGNLLFTSNHINLMRWRVRSPGEGR